MIKAVIIDDEPLARSIICEYLDHYPQIAVIGECDDGFEGAKSIIQLNPDVVFLDVQMPKINGFEMLELLNKRPAVIFTTAFDEFAIRAFEQHAVDYLLKPVSKARFDKAMTKFLDQQQLQSEQENTRRLLQHLGGSPNQRLERIVVKTGQKIKIIPLADLIYLAADDDYVRIHTTDGVYLKNKTMSVFEQELDPAAFLRVHRSYIVRLDAIARLEPYEKDSYIAVLKNGDKISMSKAGYARLKTVIGDW